MRTATLWQGVVDSIVCWASLHHDAVRVCMSWAGPGETRVHRTVLQALAWRSLLAIRVACDSAPATPVHMHHSLFWWALWWLWPFASWFCAQALPLPCLTTLTVLGMVVQTLFGCVTALPDCQLYCSQRQDSAWRHNVLVLGPCSEEVRPRLGTCIWAIVYLCPSGANFFRWPCPLAACLSLTAVCCLDQI
jgi:hypothetical protein